MLKNIKITTSLIFIFIFFCLLQLTSSTLGFYRAKVAANDFNDVVNLNQQREYLASAKEALLRARIASNKTVIMTLIENSQEADKLLKTSEDNLQFAKKQFELFFNLELTSEKGKLLEEPIKTSHSELITILEQQLTSLKAEGEKGYLKYDVEPIQIKLDSALEAFSTHIQSMIVEKEQENKNEVTIAQIQLATELFIIIAIMTGAIIWLQNIINKPIQNLLSHFEYITDGDLTHDIPAEGKNEIGRLFEFFNKMQNSLINTVDAVRQTTDTMVASIEHLAKQNDNLATRTEQQAASLEVTAASMEELTSTVRLNADNAVNASAVANDTSTTAIKGGEITKTVVSTMQEISDSSQKIGAITNVIDGIAFQTNILALNAAVEAARAGEQGRGFAVVAGEVRNLAQRSAQAASEITTLIEDALTKVKTGSILVNNSGTTMDDIVSSVSKVNHIISEISSASSEQSKGIDLISQAIQEMDAVTQHNSALVSELTGSAHILEQQATALTKAVSVFKI